MQIDQLFMRKAVSVLFLSFTFSIASSQVINREPLSERITGYTIDASLDPVTKTVTGNMNAYWVNSSGDIVPDIHMHLYMNAFRSEETTFRKESDALPFPGELYPGWIDVLSFSDRKGTNLLGRMEYISPDDGNPYDKTVIRVSLPEPAKPGDTVFVSLQFETKLPNVTFRTGYNDDFFFVAQWFPKFGVYEPAGMRYAIKGAWNCHQFHANSEFYSNHSVYEVTISLPSEYVVGTCGMLISETVTGEGIKTSVYRAEDIVDFAWTAWPDFTVIKDKWKHVDITLLIPPERSSQAERQFRAVKNALEYFNNKVGPYPWPHLTIVDPPMKGAGAGGMEYTTMFTTSSFFAVPGFFYLPEQVTVHEFGHAYFMGILATNEFEEPWLDEGINSFFEQRIMDHYYGPGFGFVNHPVLKISAKEFSRKTYINSNARQIASNGEYSWNYPLDSYWMLNYSKASVILHTLMGLTGEDTMDDIFREYYRKWGFRHPSGKNFMDVVNEVVRKNHGETFSQEINRFFDQTVYGTGICDYSVTCIANKKVSGLQGKTDSTDITAAFGDEKDTFYTSVATIQREGEVILPVDVLIHFDDGSEVTEKWDGQGRYKEYSYTGLARIQWVKIDPLFKISMDINRVNNSETTDPDRLPLRRLFHKLTLFIQACLGFMLL